MCFFLGEMYVYIFCPLRIKRHSFAYCLLLVCRSFLSLSCFYLFAVSLGLCWCSRAVSSCGERETVVQLRCVGLLPWLLSLWSTGSRCAGFSSCGQRAQQLWLEGSKARAQLWRTCSVAPKLVGSSWTRDRVGVPCIARRVLTTGPPRKPPILVLNITVAPTFFHPLFQVMFQ